MEKMDCKDFKTRVADLFDVRVDKDSCRELFAHIEECPECKLYYEDMKAAFSLLQPRRTFTWQSQRPKRKPRRRMWNAVAAVVISLVSFGLGWSHLFTSSARAAEGTPFTLADGVKYVQNVGSFRMVAYVRTTPDENFAYFDSKADFVRVNIGLMRQNDSIFFRVEKEGGRTVVCDGVSQYMWTGKGGYFKAGLDAGFLESFANLLHPERLLEMQRQVVYFSEKNKETRIETDSTIVINVEGKQFGNDLDELFMSGRNSLYPVTIKNVFSRNDGLLRYVEVAVNGVVMMRVNDIRYNVMMSKKSLVALPDVTADTWNEMKPQSIEKSRLKALQGMSAEEAAQYMIEALCNGTAAGNPAFVQYKNFMPKLSKLYKGCKASDFTSRSGGDYAGVHVFYKLTRPDGRTEQAHIAIRNDNEQHIWIVDGGL